MKEKKRLTGCTPLKGIVHVLFVIVVLIGILASLVTIDIFEGAPYLQERLQYTLEDTWVDTQVVSYYRFIQFCEDLIPLIALGCIVAALLCVLFLLVAVGRKNGKQGIVSGVFGKIYFDILTVIYGVGAGCLIAELADFHWMDSPLSRMCAYAFMAGIGAVLALWTLIYIEEFTLRIKKGGWWKHTLIYQVLRYIGKGLGILIHNLPILLTTVIVFLGISLVEFFVIASRSLEVLLLFWVVEKLVIFLVIIYVTLTRKKLLAGGKALADGDLNYKVDTSKMILDMKTHGEHLNSIGQGMTAAVEERMKSERFKTELITNVSHDLKTPLTSIINYADLLGADKLEPEQVSEYADVLLRQSQRLKKLLEDLLEASKATTGSIEVTLDRCEVGVLLTQAAGEYEQRFAERDLNLVTKQPEDSVYIMADGRHLWRVFDNLLNNAYKYAQENSRVYLSLERDAGKAKIIFRNMSKYVLNVTAEELEERFVRGDKSRHMEGNGLGLSIAKSLVELQNGQMEITVDGDLFKVVLIFEES